MNINPNSLYNSYNLSEAELLEGCLLNPHQRARIQNMRLETIEQKLSLAPSSLTPDGKESYWQQEAYLRGQLDILTNLLGAADVAQSQLLQSDEPISTFNSSI